MSDITTPDTHLNATQDLLPGQWPDLKSQVQQRWAKLTDEDLAHLSGKTEELAGVLQLTHEDSAQSRAG